MTTQVICRPFITLRNGKVLFAHQVGKQAFCFPVTEVKPKKRPAKIVRFKLKVRPVIGRLDATRDCPFPIICPETYSMHRNALKEDIEQLDDVSSVSLSEKEDLILIDTTLSEEELLEKMKPLFTRSFICLRFSGIDKL